MKAQPQIKSLNFSTGWKLEVERRNAGIKIIRKTNKKRGFISTCLFSTHKWNKAVMICSFQSAEYIFHLTVLYVLIYTQENENLSKQNPLYTLRNICSIHMPVNIIQYFTLFQGPIKAKFLFFLLNYFHWER